MRLLSIVLLQIGGFYYCQNLLVVQKPIEPVNPIIFRYDEAGNQIFRGPSIIFQGKQEEPAPISNALILASEDVFWLGVNIYPVPVKTTLTISWNEENNALIDNVTLYQHSTMAYLFQQENIANLNREVHINMNGYYPGVYILNFQLKDGRVFSRNILKE